MVADSEEKDPVHEVVVSVQEKKAAVHLEVTVKKVDLELVERVVHPKDQDVLKETDQLAVHLKQQKADAQEEVNLNC